MPCDRHLTLMLIAGTLLLKLPVGWGPAGQYPPVLLVLLLRGRSGNSSTTNLSSLCAGRSSSPSCHKDSPIQLNESDWWYSCRVEPPVPAEHDCKIRFSMGEKTISRSHPACLQVQCPLRTVRNVFLLMGKQHELGIRMSWNGSSMTMHNIARPPPHNRTPIEQTKLKHYTFQNRCPKLYELFSAQGVWYPRPTKG